MPVFEPTLLPDFQKEELCRNLLTEFGANNVQQRYDELIHGCLLPFSNHTDQNRNPTASLNWKKLTYKCLGCGSGGGLLWFIAACRPGSSATAARKWLQEATGIGGAGMGLAALLEFFDALYASKGKSRYEPIPVYSDRILNQWDWRHPYMTEVRGVPEATLDHFRVGYAAAYQVSRDPDVFSQRITIPHLWEGSLVGWQTRRLLADGSPKYLSSPDFPREQTLYNYDPKQKSVVLVESPFSVLRHHHQGHMVATFGASVTERQIALLQRYERVVLFMDNDDAGWGALNDLTDRKGKVERTGLINALKNHTQVYVVDNPWAADAADMDDATYARLIDDAVPWPIWSQPKSLYRWEEVSA